MRILHTSDWHLGQHFMGKTRQAEHQALIDWLLVQVQEHAVDAVLIAGDVFDSGTPPSYARELYNQLVLALHRIHTPLIILGGNHDAVATLNESRALCACLGTQVIATVAEDPAQHVLLLNDRTGQPGALLCAIPFIRPRDVLLSQAGQSAIEKQGALQAAIAQYYAAVYQHAVAQRDALGLALPIMATGHLTTVGASSSESVRDIYVGTLEAFPSHAFPAVDYLALGHIHRPQKVGGLEHIRYSGSPLALSFDEVAQQKEMLLVELDLNGLRQVTSLPIPCWQPLLSLRGNLVELAQAIHLAAQQGSAQHPVWLEMVVREDDYLSDVHNRVQALTDGLPVEVLRLRRERGQTAATLPGGEQDTLTELSPYDVFAKRLAQEDIDPPLQQQLSTRYRDIVLALETAKTHSDRPLEESVL